jgi:peptide chain release factor 1
MINYQHIKKEYEEILDKLGTESDSQELAKLGRRQSELLPMVKLTDQIDALDQEISGHEKLIADKSELSEMAASELPALKTKREGLFEDLKIAMLPKDPYDEKNTIIEIRAGAGGDEAGLFAAELFRMYSKYAEKLKHKIAILASSRTSIGGFKEIIFEVLGRGAYSKFKYESGVHRVQRVPETEKSGRVHTSTVTVAVMPEIEEADFKIDMKDLKIEPTTSSGHGGQSVNTTYSAIRMTHLPTGVQVVMQDERSQAQNRQKALDIMRARLLALEEERKRRELSEKRKSQIGTGDRSEKIRTYNFPQDRITDHRINQNFSQILNIMEGNMGQITDAMVAEDHKRRLEDVSK